MNKKSLGIIGLVIALAAIAFVALRPSHDPTAATNNNPKATKELRLAYFPNLTHAPALVGVANGIISQQLPDYRLETKVVNAGPEAMEALLAGAIDAAYVGPSPAINTYIKSGGKALTIIAGACEGGASLIARPGVEMASVADLKGHKVAIPQVGGTQDVSLRHFMAENKLAPTDKGGDVTIQAVQNPDVLALFKSKELDAAWVPEPWAARLEVEAGAKQVADERDLWPSHKFTTTVLVVSTKFAKEHPDAVDGLIKANQKSVDWINANPADAKTVVNGELKKLTGKTLAAAVLDKAWGRLTFVSVLDQANLTASIDAAKQVGYLKDPLPDMTALTASPVTAKP